MIIVLFFKGVQLVEIKNTFSELNLFYKTQKHKILVGKGKILIKLQKLRKKSDIIIMIKK